MSTTVGTAPGVNAGDEWYFSLGDNIFSTTVPTGPMTVAFPDRGSTTITPPDGSALVYDSGNWTWSAPDEEYISKATLKAEVAAATDFADFQARIAAL